MKRLVELSELAYVAYVAYTHNISMKEFCEFLMNYPDLTVQYLVNCSDCKYYEAKKSGFCRYWKTFDHLPVGFCEHGDDSTRLM